MVFFRKLPPAVKKHREEDAARIVLIASCIALAVAVAVEIGAIMNIAWGH